MESIGQKETSKREVVFSLLEGVYLFIHNLENKNSYQIFDIGHRCASSNSCRGFATTFTPQSPNFGEATNKRSIRFTGSVD